MERRGRSHKHRAAGAPTASHASDKQESLGACWGGLTVTGESMRPSLPEMELLRVSVGVPGQCGRKETGSR